MSTPPPDRPRPGPGDREGPDPDEVAARWEEIVAGLGAQGFAEGASGDPTVGDGSGDAPESAGSGGDADDDADGGWGEVLAGPRGAVASPGDDEDPLATDFRAWTPAEDPNEDHFVPPDPGPVGGDPMLTLSWVVAVGVPVLALVMIVAWRTAPLWLMAAAGAAWFGAVAALVWRIPATRDDDDGPGAVV